MVNLKYNFYWFFLSENTQQNYEVNAYKMWFPEIIKKKDLYNQKLFYEMNEIDFIKIFIVHRNQDAQSLPTKTKIKSNLV